MRGLTGELLLKAWETGATEHSLDRALTMLSLGLPEGERKKLAELSIADRDRLLLQLRAATFGPELKAFATCLHCSARMEFALSIERMLAQLKDVPVEAVEWQACGRQLRLRPVNTQDLLALATVEDAEEAQQLLLRRCSNLGEEPRTEAAVTLLESVLKQFDALHGGTELRCSIQCPECSASEALDLDIAGFLWLEVRHAAQRLLCEIHLLASAYGWSETSIAQMPQRRRNAYLEMLEA